MRESELLSPEAAARVQQIEFFARTRVEGFLKGSNPSHFRGVSPEFMQHRAYVPGDDLRHLNWRIYGRTDRLVTREFEEFTNLDVILVLDFSGSMAYGDAPMSKMDFALHAAALLGYLLNLRNDRFGLAACSEQISFYLPPSNGKKHLAEFYRRLVSLPVSGEARLARCSDLLLHLLRRRSVVLFFTDAYEDPDPLTHAVGQLRLRGHDVTLYQVVHEAEKDLDFTGFTLFRDLETGAVDAADPLEIRQAYRDVVEEHGQALRTGTARFAVEFHSMAVTENWDQVIAALLHERSAMMT
ncbi:MAG: DUF58 domain-containing protein [Planctomycetes bacterium]|nr:DUF58 domain-containing protein [Planctomycetota bacterium]